MRRLLVALVLVACGDDVPPPVEPTIEVTDPLAHVDPTIGTGGLGFAHGSCFVGAAAPHGLVKLGPDTAGPYGTVNFLHYSGYWSGDDRIRGFSTVHLHGAGATDYGVLSLMPVLAFDPAKTSVVDYEQRFAKADEHASIGHYDVTLANGIRAELAATPRAAVHRYTLPAAGAVVIDLAKTLDGGEVTASELTVGATEITGSLHHRGGMSRGFGGYTIYFAATVSSGLAMHHDFATGTAIDLPAGATTIAMGISLVSIEGARANLVAEVGAKSFDEVVAATRAAWGAKLGAVPTITATERDARVFYTSLYHAYLMPSVIDDADGTYVLAGQAPITSTTHHQMSDLSLWDTYRTVAPLYAWLAPDSARDQARSLIAFADGLGAYPRWPLAIGESGVMLGASAEIVVADATVRGALSLADAERAWPRLRAAAMDPIAPPGGRGGREAVEPYMQYGYVPAERGRSASTTTEYAHDDFALAQLAGALGETADRDALLARSHGWRMLYDPAVGFVRARNADGSFPSGTFDPLEMSEDYAEANAWHSLWMAGAHDSAGLAELLGGTDLAVAKLVTFFTEAKRDWEDGDPSAANFPRPYYWHGNEPDLNAPLLFAQWGRPALAQRWTRWVADTMYDDTPEGVAGNDDGGTLGSWYVLTALGVYPIPGSDRWIVGAPRFAKAVVSVGASPLTITTEGRGAIAVSMTIDGVLVEGPMITHAQLLGAREIHVVLSTD